MTNPVRARITRRLAENSKARRRQDDEDKHSTKISLAPPNQYDDSARRKMLEEKLRILKGGH
jgi:hypothetical protein